MRNHKFSLFYSQRLVYIRNKRESDCCKSGERRKVLGFETKKSNVMTKGIQSRERENVQMD